MTKKLICLGVVLVMLGVFGFTACTESLADYKVAGKAKIDVHVATKTQSDYSTEKWKAILSIATAGKRMVEDAITKPQVDVTVDKTKEAIDMGVLEIEVDNMVDCSGFRYNNLSSWIGPPIQLKHQDGSISFKCIVDKGVIGITGDFTESLTLKAGDGFYWVPGNDVPEIQQAFIDIVLTKDDIIVGYAVVEIFANGPHNQNFSAKLIKSVLFLKAEG